jgi:hypothetical protein
MKHAILMSTSLGLLSACSADVNTGRRCADGHETCTSPDTGSGEAGGGAAGAGGRAGNGGSAGTVATSENALTVHVEDIQEMTIEILTVACAGDCADIEAVAHGGNSPYAFEWEDGSQDSKRHVCLDADVKLEVSATDTAIEDPEFPHEAQTAKTEVSATVLACPGTGGPLCVKNPSFEGHAPGIGYGEAGSLAEDWTVCSATPDVCPFGDPFCMLPATDGSAYLGFGWYNLEVESAGGEFCAPLQPGQAVSFAVDIAISPKFVGVPILEFWGGATPCAKDELLWRSPPITNTDWQTYCATFTPTQAIQHFVIVHEPEAKTDSPYISLDNIRAQEGSCQ